MMKNWENNGTEEIGLVAPTPGLLHICISRPGWFTDAKLTQYILMVPGLSQIIYEFINTSNL